MLIQRWLAISALGLALVGCGQKSSTSEPTTATLPSGSLEAPLAGIAKMEIHDFSYNPPELVLKRGTVLAITNNDLTSHTVTAQDGSFDSSFIANKETIQLTFDQPGTYKINCKPHPSITGTITVVE